MYLPYSYLLGPFFILLTFIFSVVVVIGTKILVGFIKEILNPKPSTIKPIKKKYVRKPKPIKSIEINPEEIDRIYVKKSS